MTPESLTTDRLLAVCSGQYLYDNLFISKKLGHIYKCSIYHYHPPLYTDWISFDHYHHNVNWSCFLSVFSL